MLTSCTRYALVFVILLGSFIAAGQTVSIKKQPSWIKLIDYETLIADTVNSGGSYNLHWERQYNVKSKETFVRIATKVLNENGLESTSSISVNYEPSFQQLTFHYVIIRRGSARIDKLKTNKFEVIRREENLERLMFDKSLDAYVNLDDVKVGDIVEYAYTVQGTNPIFQNKFFKTISLNLSSPVGRVFVDVLCPPDRTLTHKIFGHAPEPSEKVIDGNRHYTWDLSDVAAAPYEDRTPAWFDSYDYVEFSEYGDWKDVTEWALPLYPIKPASFSPALRQKVEEIKKGNDRVDARIAACIRFVQDEVRYLAFLDGVHGFKPNDASLIFDRKFGDCKDKSMLLSSMLTAMGLKSYPALVNSSYGKALSETLPSPSAFDHCIVQYVFEDSTYWVDPTMTLQRGAIADQYFPDYAYALVIAPSEQHLVTVPVSRVESKTTVKEEFFVEKVGTTAKLVVTTTYTGFEANSMRSYWKSNSATDIRKNYTDFYANDFTSIKAKKNVEFVDDEFKNVLTSYEEYIIDPFWEYDSVAEKYTVSFYGRIIRNALTQPSTKVRNTPLVISYPNEVDQEIIIHLPEAWSIEKTSKSISSKGFIYSSNVDYAADTATLHWKYQAVADHISAEDSKQHIKKIDEALGDLSFQIYYNVGSSKNKTGESKDYVSSLVVLLMLGIGVFVILKLRNR